jgi:hypothetical protein
MNKSVKYRKIQLNPIQSYLMNINFENLIFQFIKLNNQYNEALLVNQI